VPQDHSAFDEAAKIERPRWLCQWRITWRSAFDRSGPRPDLPEGCPEKFDWKLMREAWRYDLDRRPAIEVEQVKYGGHVAIVRLTSDWQIENFVGPASLRP